MLRNIILKTVVTNYYKHFLISSKKSELSELPSGLNQIKKSIRVGYEDSFYTIAISWIDQAAFRHSIIQLIDFDSPVDAGADVVDSCRGLFPDRKQQDGGLGNVGKLEYVGPDVSRRRLLKDRFVVSTVNEMKFIKAENKQPKAIEKETRTISWKGNQLLRSWYWWMGGIPPSPQAKFFSIVRGFFPKFWQSKAQRLLEGRHTRTESWIQQCLAFRNRRKQDEFVRNDSLSRTFNGPFKGAHFFRESLKWFKVLKCWDCRSLNSDHMSYIRPIYFSDIEIHFNL